MNTARIVEQISKYSKTIVRCPTRVCAAPLMAKCGKYRPYLKKNESYIKKTFRYKSVQRLRFIMK